MHIADFYEDPLYGQLNIHQVNEQLIESNKSNVQVLTFSSNSLIFASDLKFPITESVVYRICLQINQAKLELFGYITAIIQSDYGSSHLYEYTYIVNKSKHSSNSHLLAYRQMYLEKYQLSLEMNHTVKELDT
ncbi:hypothetical protein [Halalkalibacter sp. APA_J-10(15)]|uniref:hypothetical protein n=1 Tax=unclassified Halalkalibacter TaxID=2893063 RepID=UPI001FF21F4E|nr:hypothetical protein [Halalkalibacter sp. APA_J-10(15)]MCK0470360.1 hypothetical protein [Halalkalibacter sp. APA_J-10(15)]